MGHRRSGSTQALLVLSWAALSACHEYEGGSDTSVPRDAQADGARDAAGASDASCATGGSSCEDGGSEQCTRDDQCAPSMFCARTSQRCEPRCDPNDGCIGPTIAVHNNRLVSDDEHVCYADEGEGAGQFSVRAWDGLATEPSRLGSGPDARVLLIADGYCYFAVPSLRRTALSGGTSELVQELDSAPRRAWLTKDAVWWTAARGDALEVYRLPRTTGGRVERVATVSSTTLWEVGNGTHLFRRFQPSFGSCAIAMAPIDDLTRETTIPMSFSRECVGPMFASDESLVFMQYEPVHFYPFRIDFADPSVEHTIRLSSVEPLMMQVRGAWAYGQSVVDSTSTAGFPYRVTYQRARLSGEPMERLLTPSPGTARFDVEPFALEDNVQRTFAVLGQRLIYQHDVESRLIVAPLPAEP